MGINESPDRFIGNPTSQKTTASSFSRLGLCALTIWAAEHFARAGERSTIVLKAELARWTPKGERLLIAMRKEVMGMMKPMTKKLLLGIPTVTLSAVLACTVAGCGGNAPSGSGGSAPVQEKSKKAKAYESQTVEVAGITYESVAHGTFYRGDAKKQDGFYLHIKITNNNTKNRTFSSFKRVHAAQGDLEAGDPLFTSGKAAVLDYVASEAPDELHEGIDLSREAGYRSGR